MEQNARLLYELMARPHGIEYPTPWDQLPADKKEEVYFVLNILLDTTQEYNDD